MARVDRKFLASLSYLVATRRNLYRIFVRKAIETAGAELKLLPPYSPDFNSIEMAFSKIKTHLRAVAARTLPDLWNAIRDAIDAVTPADCRSYFTAAGYEPD